MFKIDTCKLSVAPLDGNFYKIQISDSSVFRFSLVYQFVCTTSSEENNSLKSMIKINLFRRGNRW